MPMISCSAMRAQELFGDPDVLGSIDVDRIAGVEAVQQEPLLEQEPEELAERAELPLAGFADVRKHFRKEEVRAARHPAAAGGGRAELRDAAALVEPEPERLFIVDERRYGERSAAAVL